MKDLKLLKVLIAEDDEINQLVVKIIFKQIGCSYDLVENGLLVIEKMKQSDYDLVLMDIEMPEMDGYEATQKIRKDFAAPRSEVPIIAITAHISETELKKCIDVGMNGYIFKPLKLKDLVSKINSVLGGTDESIEKKASHATIKGFNLKNLYASCSENPAIVKNVVNLFVTQTPGNLLQLQELLVKEDWENLKNLCHKIKAVFALIGSEEIKNYLNEIEEDCANKNINAIKFEKNITTIQNLSHTLLRELQETVL